MKHKDGKEIGKRKVRSGSFRSRSGYWIIPIFKCTDLRILAPTGSLKSSKVDADITLAGRPFQRRTVDGKKDLL